MKTLETLFFNQLGDIYDAEHRLLKALPKMAKAATEEELRQAFEDHLEATQGHVQMVEEVFQAFGRNAKSNKCPAMEGLLKEADELAADNHGFATINAALISAAQKVEHYEIATYGCLKAWAEHLGNDQAVDLLDQILDQEKAADEKLTELAEERCNEAAQGDSSESVENGHGHGPDGGAGRGQSAGMRTGADS